jgi:protein-disulfide isomerase
VRTRFPAGFPAKHFLVELCGMNRPRHAIIPHPPRLARHPHPGEAMKTVDQISDDDHVRGPKDATLTLIEYADFQCPYCARAHEVLQALSSQFSLRLVYRHLPLTDFHPLAAPAAIAAEAAGLQGKFWEMHDALFEEQNDIQEEQDLIDLADSLGLDAKRFHTDLQGHAASQRVQASLTAAREQGLHRTPTFFINGVQYDGDSDQESMEQALNQALDQAS